MENQHRKIRGYRDLNHDEIDLINEIKDLEIRATTLHSRVAEHLERQRINDAEAKTRHQVAEPARWLAMARSDLQVGFMKLVRAVAQPTSG